MASINGIEVKKIVTFKDHEGAPIKQGNIYYKGKLLGEWSQDAWGGPDSYGFNESILDDEVKKYSLSKYVKDKYRDLMDLDLLLYDLIYLIDTEKEYKKGVKKGYSTYVTITDGYHYKGYYCCDNEPEKTNYYKDFVKECEKEFFKNEPLKINVYKSLKDFKVEV